MSGRGVSGEEEEEEEESTRPWVLLQPAPSKHSPEISTPSFPLTTSWRAAAAAAANKQDVIAY